MVVSTLLQSIKGIANVALITVIVYLVFAILGVQLFAGKLYFCTDRSISSKEKCVGEFNDTQIVPTIVLSNCQNTSNISTNQTMMMSVGVVSDREWITYDFNFDNVYRAFLTLFNVATLNNWAEIMYTVIDSTGVGTGPQVSSSPALGLYFVIFIIMGSFFLLNMFVGVIIFNFNEVKQNMDGSSLLTHEQKLWVETQRMMLNYRPERRKKAAPGKIQQLAFDLSEDVLFEAGTGVLIMLNILFIGIEHFEQSADFTLAMFSANIVFVAVFLFEAIVKIVGQGGGAYFEVGWNRFDFFLVVISVFDLSTDGLIPVNVGLLRVLRVFRIMRILALVKKAKDVRILLETLWYSLPSLANIGAFLILIFFIYSVLGVQMFALVKRRGALTFRSNFENFGNAFLVLIRVATCDDWGNLMIATMDTANCGPSTNTNKWDDCGTPVAPIYFLSFIVIAGFVIVNLFVAIIVDNFNTTMALDKGKLKLQDLKKFTDTWSHFDPEANLLLETSKFPMLLAKLKPPLGITRAADRVALTRHLADYAIPEHGGVIHFVETMIPMARKVTGVSFSYADIREHEDNWRTQFPDLNNLAVLRYAQQRVTVLHYFGAAYMGAAERRRKAIKVANEMRRERRQTIVEAYDAQGVPMEQRVALIEMDHRAKIQERRDVVRDDEIQRVATFIHENSSFSTAPSRMNMNNNVLPFIEDDPLMPTGQQATDYASRRRALFVVPPGGHRRGCLSEDPPPLKTRSGERKKNDNKL